MFALVDLVARICSINEKFDVAVVVLQNNVFSIVAPNSGIVFEVPGQFIPGLVLVMSFLQREKET